MLQEIRRIVSNKAPLHLLSSSKKDVCYSCKCDDNASSQQNKEESKEEGKAKIA